MSLVITLSQNAPIDNSVLITGDEMRNIDGTYFDFIYYVLLGSVDISAVYNADHVGLISL